MIQGFSKILVSREIVQHVKEAVLLSEKKRLISENEYIKAAEESVRRLNTVCFLFLITRL